MQIRFATPNLHKCAFLCYGIRPKPYVKNSISPILGWKTGFEFQVFFFCFPFKIRFHFFIFSTNSTIFIYCGVIWEAGGN